jgi:uncharacterized membrane protein YphA (DoxX/SURF4 family)
MQDRNLNTSWWALRVAYGVVPIIAGLDKFTNLLTDWRAYLSPIAQRILPFSGTTFMYLVGIVEVVVGILVLTKWTRYAAYVASAWLVCIALNLLTTGKYFDIAARDVVMAVGAFTLARLTEEKEHAGQISDQAADLRPARAGA